MKDSGRVKTESETQELEVIKSRLVVGDTEVWDTTNGESETGNRTEDVLSTSGQRNIKFML